MCVPRDVDDQRGVREDEAERYGWTGDDGLWGVSHVWKIQGAGVRYYFLDTDVRVNLLLVQHQLRWAGRQWRGTRRHDRNSSPHNRDPPRQWYMNPDVSSDRNNPPSLQQRHHSINPLPRAALRERAPVLERAGQVVVRSEGAAEEHLAGRAQVYVFGVGVRSGEVAVEVHGDDGAFEAGGAEGVEGGVDEGAVDRLGAEVVDCGGEGGGEVGAGGDGGTKEDGGWGGHWMGEIKAGGGGELVGVERER